MNTLLNADGACSACAGTGRVYEGEVCKFCDPDESMNAAGAKPILVVRQKQTGLFLRMSKFDPETQEPVYGPLESAWLADNEPQAIAQASFLGSGDDHEVVRVAFTEQAN